MNGGTSWAASLSIYELGDLGGQLAETCARLLPARKLMGRLCKKLVHLFSFVSEETKFEIKNFKMSERDEN
jgi:hypothetical protein